MRGVPSREARGTVVVLWTGYRAGPWVCRSLAAAGWEVLPVHPRDEGTGRSTAAWSPRPVPSPTREPERLLAELRTICVEAGAQAVLPVDEDCVRLLAIAGADLGPARAIAPTPVQWEALCDKARLGETARAARVGHPATALVTAGGIAGPWPALPSVVKVRGAPAPARAIEVVRVDTASQRDRAVGRLLGVGLDAVVQELLTGPHHTVHCVRGADGFRAVTGRIVRTFPRGAGMPSVFEVDGGEGPAVVAAHALLDALDYRGPANVQLFERGGQMLVHDVNLRPPAPVALAMRAGLDLPALGLAAGLGLPLGPEAPIRGGGRYLSLVDELRALRHRGEAGPADPSALQILLDVAEGVISRRVLLDPPLGDPLWIAPVVRAHVPAWARRAVRAARRARAARPRASP